MEPLPLPLLAAASGGVSAADSGEQVRAWLPGQHAVLPPSPNPTARGFVRDATPPPPRHLQLSK